MDKKQNDSKDMANDKKSQGKSSRGRKPGSTNGSHGGASKKSDK